ncbi:MAG: 4'-phosphopantetheinyl transferase superfamily protein [Rudanella sp.]|nr:4'-phosphopantetheinyl transferase superfamily protein [Rudanella sp.]
MITTTVTCLPRLTVHWQPWQLAPIAEATISVFRTKIIDNESIINNYHSLLQPREQQRAARFRQTADRNRYILGRGLFRVMAGQITGKAPQSVSIVAVPTGKPILRENPNWHFSVSHTGDWVLLAVGQTPLGVDIEFVNPRFIIDDLIPSVLSAAEQRVLIESTDSHLFFYECWTRKEALVKATGEGITNDFINIPALEGEHMVKSSLIGNNFPWQIQPFFVSDTYPAALANVYINSMESPQFYEIDPARLSEWVAVH